MNRTTRQVSAIDITQKERALEPANPIRREPPRFPCYCQRRSNTSLLQRLRQSSTQALITGSCSNMREFCTSIQGITAEVNNILNAIENFLPLLNTYLNTAQTRETISISPANLPKQPSETISTPQTSPSSPTFPRQPRPEDIQQLLENPLVKNLLSSFVQNTAPKN